MFPTIVGGRASGPEHPPAFPRGMELLLKKAKADPEFRTLFLTSPMAAARRLGLSLSETESKILQSMPRNALDTAVKHIRLPKAHIPVFRAARNAGTLMAALALTVVMPPEVAAARIYEEPYVFVDSRRLAADKMAAVQEALEDYRRTFGEYPTTMRWLLDDSPLGDLLPKVAIHDPWYQPFRYEGLVSDGQIINYRLESVGADLDSADDNITCPVDPDLHSFVVPNPVTMISPTNGDTVYAGDTAKLTEIEVAADHAVPDAEIVWLLDRAVIRTTRKNHKFLLKIGIGAHELVARDAQGNTDFAVFSVRREIIQ